MQNSGIKDGRRGYERVYARRRSEENACQDMRFARRVRRHFRRRQDGVAGSAVVGQVFVVAPVCVVSRRLHRNRLRCVVARCAQHSARADLRREFPHVPCHSRRFFAGYLPRGERAEHGRIRRSVCRFVVLSGGRVLPGLRHREIAQIHSGAHGHPSRSRYGAPRRQGSPRFPRGSVRRRNHSRERGRKGASRRRDIDRRNRFRHQGADGRISAARRRDGRRGAQRHRQSDFPRGNRGHQGFLRFDGRQNSGPRGKRFRTEIPCGKFHNQIRPLLHARRRHNRLASRRYPRGGNGRVVGLDLPRAQLPRRVLPMRARHLHSAVFLRGHRRRVALRHTHKRLQFSRETQCRNVLPPLPSTAPRTR